MTRVRVFTPLVAGALLVAVLAGATAGQDGSPASSPGASPAAMSPAASPAASLAAPAVSAVLLGGGEPTAAAGHELTLRRVTLPPGSGIPAHTHPGALVIYVEQGTWGYTPLSGTIELTRAAAAGATPAPAEEPAVGTEIMLNAGDVLYVEEPGDAIRNAGEEDVVLLIAGLTRVGEPFTMLMEDMATASPSPAG